MFLKTPNFFNFLNKKYLTKKVKDIGSPQKRDFFRGYTPDISKIDLQKFSHEKKFPICLVYVIWKDPSYFNALFISLITQYTYTDVSKIDVFIYIDSKLTDCGLVKVIQAFPVKVIFVRTPINLYLVTLRKELQTYDQIVLCDCESFMDGHYNLWENISQLNTSDVTMSRSLYKTSALEILFLRQKLSSPFTHKTKQKFINAIASCIDIPYEKFIKILASTEWKQGLFIRMGREFYCSSEWQSYVVKLYKTIQMNSLELAVLCYVLCKKIVYKEWEETLPHFKTVINLDNVIPHLGSPSSPAIIHPSFGPEDKNKPNLKDEFYKVLDSILNKAYRYHQTL